MARYYAHRLALRTRERGTGLRPHLRPRPLPLLAVVPPLPPLRLLAVVIGSARPLRRRRRALALAALVTGALRPDALGSSTFVAATLAGESALLIAPLSDDLGVRNNGNFLKKKKIISLNEKIFASQK